MNRPGRLRRTASLLLASLLLVSLAAHPLRAGIYEKGGANGVGARAMSMAGAYTALAQDETAAWWNPAGLGGVDTLRRGTSLGSQYDGRMRSVNFTAASPFTAGAAGAVSWQHDFYAQSAAINTDALLVAGALPLSEDRRMYLGAGLKFLFGAIHKTEATYSGMGLDLGLRYRLALPQNQALTLGLRVQDLDTRLQWSHGGQEQVPMSLALGTAWAITPRTSAVVDLESVQSGQDSNQGSQIIRLGLEHYLQEPLGLRAGCILDSRRASTFTLGAGYKVADWEVQYAFLGLVSNLGLSHRLTVRYGLPPLVTVAKKPAPTPAPTPVAPTGPREYLVELATLPEVFSPNYDGVADTVIFQGNIKEGDAAAVAAWRLSLESQEGQVVRDLSGKEFTEQMEWDGADQAGRICPDGAYLAKWLLQDDQGNRLGYAEVPVVLRTQLPRFGLQITPASLVLIGDRPEQPLRFVMMKNNMIRESGWQLIIRSENGDAVKIFRGRGPVPDSISWNGQMVNKQFIPAGQYRVILTINDNIGLQMSSMQTFDVVRIEPEASLAIQPQLLRPGDREEGQAVIKLSAEPRDKIVSWRLEIRDAASRELVRAFGRTGPLPNSVTWDATDDRGRPVRSGSYFMASLRVTFRGKAGAQSESKALATDIGNGEGGRALALHLTTVLFPSDSGTIPLEAYKYIRQAADTVKKYAKRYTVQVKGYTDSQEAQDKQFELSWERAMKVRDYLNASCGIPMANLETAGYGASLPLATESSPAGRKKNRRVEIILIIEK